MQAHVAQLVEQSIRNVTVLLSLHQLERQLRPLRVFSVSYTYKIAGNCFLGNAVSVNSRGRKPQPCGVDFLQIRFCHCADALDVALPGDINGGVTQDAARSCKPRPITLIGKTGKFLKNEKAIVHRCAQISVLFRQEKYMTNVRIVFYVTAGEKAALTKISKQTGVPASELMRRALKQWLKGQK